MTRVFVPESNPYATATFTYVPICKAAHSHLCAALSHTYGHGKVKIIVPHQIDRSKPIYSVVRNPEERLKSAYLFMKYIRPQYVEKRIFPTITSYSDMVKEILDTPNDKLDKHVKPQTALLTAKDGYWLPTDVWKMETSLQAAKKAMRIGQFTGHENKMDPSLKDEHCKLHKATREKMLERYMEDYIKFEYEIE